MRALQGFHGEFRTDDISRALYSEGAGIYRVIPRAVAVPQDLDDLVHLVRWAADTSTPLVPRGAGSGMAGGNVGSGVAVDLTLGFQTPLDINTEARTARVGASVSYGNLADAAARFGLRLPPDPASGAFCTVGGMIATNAAGARSLKYGATRRWVRALEFVTADGEAGRTEKRTHRRTDAQTHRGGAGVTAAAGRFLSDVAPAILREVAAIEAATPKTSKNSSGYALGEYARSGAVTDLLVGSEGTLAIVTVAELALAPLASANATLLITLRSLDDVGPAVLALVPFEPSACELLDKTYLDFVRAATHGPLPGDTEAILLVEFEGDARPALEPLRRIAATAELADDAASVARLWELRHLASPLLARLPDDWRSLQLVEDGCVPVAALGVYIGRLRAAARRNGFEVVIFGHAGDGHVHANLVADVMQPDLARRLAACLEEVTAAQVALAGTPSGEHGDGRLRASYLARTFGDPFADLCRRVKTAWDPRGILNPGVKIAARESTGAPVFDALKVGPDSPNIPTYVAAKLREIERAAGWGTYKLSLAPAPASTP